MRAAEEWRRSRSSNSVAVGGDSSSRSSSSSGFAVDSFPGGSFLSLETANSVANSLANSVADSADSGSEVSSFVSASSWVDWDAAFSRLRSWPLYCSDEDIGRMTPRQTFELWIDVESWLHSLSDGFRTARSVPVGGRSFDIDLSPLDSLSSTSGMSLMEYLSFREREIECSGGDWFTKMSKLKERLRKREESSASRGDSEMFSIRGRKMIPGLPSGLGLEKYDCFEIQEGEVVDGYEFGGNLFTVPLGLVLRRTKVMVMELARYGALSGYGVVMGDTEGANRFAVENCRKAEKLRRSLEKVGFELSDEDGLLELRRLYSEGFLMQYRSYLPPDVSEDEFISRFHAYLKRCASDVRGAEGSSDV